MAPPAPVLKDCGELPGSRSVDWEETMIERMFCAAIHDPRGHLLAPVAAAAPGLRTLFDGFAFNVSSVTHPPLLDLLAEDFGASIVRHDPDETRIGRFRREAVALAAEARQAVYSDIDHLLRWLAADPASLRATLETGPELDMLVVGRSPEAFALSPRRLRDTETVVNHIHRLITGENWDLMFAMRRLSQRAVRLILENATEDTLANDVEWPLLARRHGLSLGYAASNHLTYRTTEEFGAEADTVDADPLAWIKRVNFAADHARVLRAYA
jgi:hypothetical protein